MIKQIRTDFDPCRLGETSKIVGNLMDDIRFGQQIQVDRSELPLEPLVEFIQTMPMQAIKKLLESSSQGFDQPGLPGFVAAISEF